MITTAFELQGYRIVQNLGVVRGITVRSRSALGNLVGGLQTIFGGNITILQDEIAFKKRLDQVVGFDTETKALGGPFTRKDAEIPEGTITCVLKKSGELDANGNLFTEEALEAISGKSVTFEGGAVKDPSDADFVHSFYVDPSVLPESVTMVCMKPRDNHSGVHVLGQLSSFVPDPDKPTRKIYQIGSSFDTPTFLSGQAKKAFSMGCKVEPPKPCSMCNPETEQGNSEEITEEVVGYTTQDVMQMYHRYTTFSESAQTHKETVALVVDGPVLNLIEIAMAREFSKIFWCTIHHHQIFRVDKPMAAIWVWENPPWLADKKILGRFLETLEHLGEDSYYLIRIMGGKGDQIVTKGNLTENPFGLRVGYRAVYDEVSSTED